MTSSATNTNTNTNTNTLTVSFVSEVLAGKGPIGEGYYKYLYPANHKLHSFPFPKAEAGTTSAPITSYLDRITKMDYYCMPEDRETVLHQYSKPVRAVARFAFTLLVLPLIGTAGALYNGYKYAEASYGTQKKNESPSQPETKATVQINKAYEYSRALAHDLQHAAPLLGTLTCGAAAYAITTIKMTSALAFAPAIMTAIVVSIVATSVFAVASSKIATHNAWNPTDFAYTHILNPTHHTNKSPLYLTLLLRQLGLVENIEGGGKLLPSLSGDQVSIEKTKKVTVADEAASSHGSATAPTFVGPYSKYTDIIDQTDYLLTMDIMYALMIEQCYGNAGTQVQDAFFTDHTNANKIADLLEEYITPRMQPAEKEYIRSTAEKVRQGNRKLDCAIKLRKQVLDRVSEPEWSSIDLPPNSAEKRIKGCMDLLEAKLKKEEQKTEEEQKNNNVIEILKHLKQKAKFVLERITQQEGAPSLPDTSQNPTNLVSIFRNPSQISVTSGLTSWDDGDFSK